MKTWTLCGTLILAGLMAAIAPSPQSQAQSNAPAASAPKDSDTSAPTGQAKSEANTGTRSATPNTSMTPTKHRYWRHRGGSHPHYGSRRVRTQVQTPQ
jgi:hypothetical protein